jgi:type IV pilus assembly protein PilW
MKQRPMASHWSRARRRMLGFTLIELMIAMLLGLIVVGGVSSIFLANQQTYRSNEALSEVQDGARVAFELLARDIRVAGLSGCNTTSGRVANTVNGAGTSWFLNWNNALIGYDDASTDPSLSTLTGAGSPVAKTSSVHILTTGSVDTAVAATQGNNPAEVKITQPTTQLNVGDVVVVCDYDHSTILQITGPNGGFTDHFNHDAGGNASPGNCSKGMGYPTVCTSNGNAYTFPPNSQIAKLNAHVWYIGNNPVGGKSLYRLAVVNQSGTGGSTVAQVPQEMVRNVTNMQIKYLQPPNPTKFDVAANMTNWATVDSAQVTLTLQSTFQSAGTNGQPLVRTFTSTATVRNRVL